MSSNTKKQFYLICLLVIMPFLSHARNVNKHELSDSITSFALKYAKTDTIKVERQWLRNNVLYIEADITLSGIPFSPENIAELKNTIRVMHGSKSFDDIVIISDKLPIEEYIANRYLPQEKRRNLYQLPATEYPLVKNTSLAYHPTSGLGNRHLVISGSHGEYFEQSLNRWEWQRARLQQTVEDLFTSSITLPFLIPMLENAGANVLTPRERDTQLSELILDFDHTTDGEVKINNNNQRWKRSDSLGFAHRKEFYTDYENPFRMGTYHYVNSETIEDEKSTITWKAKIRKTGDYAVYVSYKTLPKSTSQAHYTVHHAGGKTDFTVNQRMGGGTWIYLGTFKFSNHKSVQNKIVLSNYSQNKDEIISADAVKIGGGMGNVARRPTPKILPDSSVLIDYAYQLSNSPRYMEAARYWMQWAGVPDSIYIYDEGQSDYLDDLSSRGKWINFISGGSVANPNQEGLSIPLDLALCLHSDAGVTPNDSIVGTLGIHTTWNNDGDKTYPNGVSRMHVRDLTDMVQSQVVSDLQKSIAPEWERRDIYNRSYAESRHPNIPTTLIELLSHQNFADMRYGNDPYFKFTAARAIYKGILKYLHLQYGTEYTVQPLPINSFAINRTSEQNVILNWKASVDALENTAIPSHYVVYTRIDNRGFDNGVRCDSTFLNLKIEKDKHYSFRVVAANAGGASLASETLSAYIASEEKGTALIINAFDRVAAPESFSIDSTCAGFVPNDNGVPYMHDISFVGNQYEYDRNKPWIDDDDPGYGASHATYEKTMIAGNTFDYSLTHGRAIARAKYSYVSCSQHAIDTSKIDMQYSFVDVIFGKQKRTVRGTEKPSIAYRVFDEKLKDAIQCYTRAGVDVLISGAYVASDIWNDTTRCVSDRKFAEDVLHYGYRATNASCAGKVKTVASPFKMFETNQTYSYFTQPNSVKYHVSDPDAIVPKGENTYALFHYADNNKNAGIIHAGKYKTCVLAFPLESLQKQSEIDKLMLQIVRFFE